MPPLKPWQIIPVPPPPDPCATSPSLAVSSAAKTCSARTCIPSMSLSRPSYVSPTTGRCQRPAVRAMLRGDERIAHDPDRERVRDSDRRRKQARLADPLEPGQLAVSVQPVRRRKAWRAVGRGEDDGHASAHVLAFDERRVADADAGDVRDRVQRPGLELADRDAELACPHEWITASTSSRLRSINACERSSSSCNFDTTSPTGELISPVMK